MHLDHAPGLNDANALDRTRTDSINAPGSCNMLYGLPLSTLLD
jgi:hypothetical protein